MDLSSIVIYPTAISLMASLLIVWTRHWHGRLSFDTIKGIQKMHQEPTPRVGGAAIVLGVVVGMLLGSQDTQRLLAPLLLAGTLAFFVGLLEDLSNHTGIALRLLVTFLAGVLVCGLTDLGIVRVDIPFIDRWLDIPVFSLLFTAFAICGLTNAVNIVDGFNGLAAGSVIISILSLSFLAFSMGDAELAACAWIIAASAFGFMVVNWPWGKLFLGDGGAYFLGFAMAWIIVLLHVRHPEVSPWALLLICSYPVLEVLFSISRRVRRSRNPGMPDRLHLHSLVHRRLVRRLLPNARPMVQNSLTGALMSLASLLPASLALQWPSSTGLTVFALVACAFLYSALHARLTQFHWCIVPEAVRTAPNMP